MEKVYDSCEHIQRYKEENGVYSYEILHAYYVSCIAKKSRKRKARDCICQEKLCKAKTVRIHACLYCAFFGCFIKEHIQAHAEEYGHFLAVDTNLGFVYCFECRDYKYDDDLEKISHRNKLLATAQLETYKWMPSPATTKHLQQHDVFELGQSGIVPRGIVNMGHTCYMSIIIQSLVHAPIFRNYFLSGRHKCHLQKNPESQGQLTNLKNLSVCFVCEMSSIVQEFFCGKNDPFIPDRLLYLTWTHIPSLAAYDQQDAYEFLLEFLNIMHQHSVGTNGHFSSCKYYPNCLIDSAFTGMQQSEIICLKCKHVSKKVDTFRGISLNLNFHTETLPKDTAAKKNDSSVSTTLAKCLERFTEREFISRSCDKCAASVNESTEIPRIIEEENHPTCSMQTTFKKLPIIIIFHFKRATSLGKCEKPVDFPEFLDVTPYTSSNKADAFSNKFYLFAVLCHRGGSDGGHYFCYVRQHKNKWFCCDDVIVTLCPFEIVQQQSHLVCVLFYHKLYFEYEQKTEQEEMYSTGDIM